MKKMTLLVSFLCLLFALPARSDTKEHWGKFDKGLVIGDYSAGTGTHIKAARIGVATFSSGIAVVADTNVTATTLIFAFRQVVSGTSGVGISVAVTAGTSFTLTSLTAGALTTQTSDNSPVAYIEIDL